MLRCCAVWAPRHGVNSLLTPFRRDELIVEVRASSLKPVDNNWPVARISRALTTYLLSAVRTALAL